ncbi:MAG: hypothetical protein WB992_00910 [Bryobacteraceae bacterium]
MHESQLGPLNEWPNNHNPTCADLMAVAERELGAFIRVVSELYGSEEAKLSAEDWLDELEAVDRLPGLNTREWRLITIAASTRLAARLTVLAASTDKSIPDSWMHVTAKHTDHG